MRQKVRCEPTGDKRKVVTGEEIGEQWVRKRKERKYGRKGKWGRQIEGEIGGKDTERKKGKMERERKNIKKGRIFKDYL